jgi:hypothetical protein
VASLGLVFSEDPEFLEEVAWATVAGGLTLAILTQPASQAVVENRPAGFSVAVSGTPPYTYQWSRNGEAIDGATASSYSFPQAGLNLDGSSFTVTVTDALSQLTSEPAILTVSPDVDAPTYQVVTSPDAGQIELVFDEALDPAGLLDIAGFSVANRGSLIAVTDVVLSADGRFVTLTTASALAGRYGVAVPAGLSDLAGNPIGGGAALQIGSAPLSAGLNVLMDFGSSGYPTGEGDDPVNTWNNVTQGIGGSSSGVLADLLTSDGDPTTIRLEMIEPFSGANASGTSSSPDFPSSATSDTLYGNTETWNGTANVFPSFRLRQLDPGTSYNLTFYASRTGAGGDNRETLYTVVGTATDTTVLNPSENVSTAVTLEDLSPDAGGNLTISIGPGPNNNNAYHFTYLGILVLTTDDNPAVGSRLFPPVPLGGNMVFVDWMGGGSLEYSGNLQDPWTTVSPVPEPPYVEPMSASGRRFFRLREVVP